MPAIGDAMVALPLSSSFNDPWVHQRTVMHTRTATVTVITGSTSSQLALPANASRLGYILVNDSPSLVYMKYGSGPANSNAFSVILPPIDLAATAWKSAIEHENVGVGVFTGQIHVVWSSGSTGSLRITEFT